MLTGTIALVHYAPAMCHMYQTILGKHFPVQAHTATAGIADEVLADQEGFSLLLVSEYLDTGSGGDFAGEIRPRFLGPHQPLIYGFGKNKHATRQAFLQAGAEGFLSCSSTPEFVRSIQKIMQGKDVGVYKKAEGSYLLFRCNDHADIALSAIATLQHDLPGRTAQIRKAFAHGDIGGLVREAHVLREHVGLCGAQRAYELADHIIASAQSTRPPIDITHITSLQMELDDLQETIEGMRAGLENSHGAAQRPAPAGTGAIALVHYNPVLRNVFKQVLEKEGFTVYGFATAQEARDGIPPLQDRLQLVLVSYYLDIAWSRDFVRALVEDRAVDPDQFLLFGFGQSSYPTIKRMNDAGCQGFISSTATRNFVERVKRILEGHDDTYHKEANTVDSYYTLLKCDNDPQIAHDALIEVKRDLLNRFAAIRSAQDQLDIRNVYREARVLRDYCGLCGIQDVYELTDTIAAHAHSLQPAIDAEAIDALRQHIHPVKASLDLALGKLRQDHPDIGPSGISAVNLTSANA